MSTKKRFTIAPDLANGLRNTIQSASNNQGQLHYDMMSLDIIELDPDNPRKLVLNREEILQGLTSSTPDYARKLKEYQALLELSESIKRVGIRNAIEVYKDGLKYRIVSGERRYWAALLAGHTSVPVRISLKPDEFHLRYLQWVENINRQDLSLWEKYHNLVLMAQAYQRGNKGEFTEQVLQSLLGVSSIQAYRYFCMLKADEQIIQLIQLGKLNNLKLVQELVTMKDKGAKAQIISWILAAKGEVTSLANYKAVAGKQALTMQTKDLLFISFGKTVPITAVKHLFEIVLADPRFSQYRPILNQIDWGSTKAITKAFNDLFQIIEKEFAA